MSEFSVSQNGVCPCPCEAARSGAASTRRFRPQRQWKDLIAAAGPLSPVEWLSHEIARLTAAMPDHAVALQAISEALLVSGDGSNPHATAAAAERLSEFRLPDRPRRNAGLLAGPSVVGGERR